MTGVRSFLQGWRDPATAQGTARWVAIGVMAWDILKSGASWPNVAGLLILAGFDLASRWITGPPAEPPGPPMPPLAPV